MIGYIAYNSKGVPGGLALDVKTCRENILNDGGLMHGEYPKGHYKVVKVELKPDIKTPRNIVRTVPIEGMMLFTK